MTYNYIRSSSTVFTSSFGDFSKYYLFHFGACLVICNVFLVIMFIGRNSYATKSN